MLNTAHRLSDLLEMPLECEAPTAPSPPRTPAQAEASRRNGAQGRGPATAAGRARSSRNALKHGLFAKRLAPHRDDAGEQQDYEQQLQGLVDEYQPQSRTEQNLVELLASDYLKLGRIREYTESVMDPGPIRTSVVGADTEGAERRLAVAKYLVTRAEEGCSFDLSDHDATWMTNELPWLHRDIRVAVRQCCSGVGKSAADTPRSRRVTLRSLGATNRRQLAAVLADEKLLTTNQWEDWKAALSQLVRVRDEALAFAQEQALVKERAYRGQQGTVLGRLQQMRLLQEYEFRVRRDIERTTNLLNQLVGRRTTGSGSFLQKCPQREVSPC